MSELILRRILDAYGASYQSIGPPQKGYRNSSYAVSLTDGRMLNLILYKSEPDILARIKRANKVANFVAAQGLPSRQSFDKRIIKLQSGELAKYAALYYYLPGDTIPWEAYTKDHLKLAGMAMSVMHQHLRHLPLPGPHVSGEYLRINKRMSHYFNSESVQMALYKKLQLRVSQGIFTKNRVCLQACYTLPNQHMLHMDFVRSNLLFKATEQDDIFVENGLALSGILDFEKTAHGHPLFDIARTLAFLLVDCKYKPPADIKKYFLRSGYAKRGGVAIKNIVLSREGRRINVLEALLEFFLFYDFYKFLRHNPYEFLAQNEHFMRTRDMLLERQMLQYR